MGYHQFTGKCDGMCDSCDCHNHPREAKAIREAQAAPCLDPCPFAGHCLEEGWCADGCEIRKEINDARGVKGLDRG